MSDDIDYSAGKKYAVWKSEENTLTDKGEDPLSVKKSISNEEADSKTDQNKTREDPLLNAQNGRYSDEIKDTESNKDNQKGHDETVDTSTDHFEINDDNTDKNVSVPSTTVVQKYYFPIGKILALFVVFSLLCSFVSVGVYRYIEKSSKPLVENISQVVPIEGVQIHSTISDAIAEVSPCVVTILKERRNEGILTNQSGSAGTGIIAASDEDNLFIVTSYHVVEAFESIFLTFYDESTTEAELRAFNENADIALLTTPVSSMQRGTLVRTAAFGNSDELLVGQTVFAIGNSLGFGFTSSSGIISALDRSVTLKNRNSGTTFSVPCVQTDTPINPGNSGGPLFNEAGEVIGIVESKYADLEVEGVAYAIPVNYVYPSIMEMVKKVKAGNERSEE